MLGAKKTISHGTAALPLWAFFLRASAGTVPPLAVAGASRMGRLKEEGTASRNTTCLGTASNMQERVPLHTYNLEPSKKQLLASKIDLMLPMVSREVLPKPCEMAGCKEQQAGAGFHSRPSCGGGPNARWSCWPQRARPAWGGSKRREQPAATLHGSSEQDPTGVCSSPNLQLTALEETIQVGSKRASVLRSTAGSGISTGGSSCGERLKQDGSKSEQELHLGT